MEHHKQCHFLHDGDASLIFYFNLFHNCLFMLNINIVVLFISNYLGLMAFVSTMFNYLLIFLYKFLKVANLNI